VRRSKGKSIGRSEAPALHAVACGEDRQPERCAAMIHHVMPRSTAAWLCRFSLPCVAAIVVRASREAEQLRPMLVNLIRQAMAPLLQLKVRHHSHLLDLPAQSAS
jgi:hypothetical protein